MRGISHMGVYRLQSLLYIRHHVYREGNLPIKHKHTMIKRPNSPLVTGKPTECVSPLKLHSSLLGL